MFWNAKNGEVRLGETSMSYASFGHGSNVLVILPGLSDGLATVKGKALLLAAPYRPYLADFTIYMFSRKDTMPEGYSIKDMAADQAQAMRKLSVERYSVLGVSQGGMIAQYLAVLCPENVEKLVIAVSAPCVNETVRGNLRRWLVSAEKGDHKQLMIDTAENSYSSEYLKKYRKMYPLLGHIGKPKDYRRFQRNAEAILSFDAEEDLRKISCPTLIIGGKEDKIVGPEASYELHEKIKGSELHMYDGLGHAAYEEAPDFNERVFGFLKN